MGSEHSPPPPASHPLRNAVVTAAVCAAAISLLAIAAELVLRAVRDPHSFYPYHRNSTRVFLPSEEVTPGVSGVSQFTTNSYGTRGPEPNGERIRIVTLGGSTTACTVLDDAEAWPALLMEKLNRAAGDPRFAWVTNAGVDGQNSDHHLMHVLYLLPLLPEIDFVLVYAGLNDAGKWLYDAHFDPDYLERLENWEHRLGEAFRVSAYTPADWPFYKRLELWKRMSIFKDRWISARDARRDRDGIEQDAELRWIEEQRRLRERVSKKTIPRAKLETLPLALDAYARNLRRIAAGARERGAEPVFAAQALADPSRMTASQERSVWMGAMEGGAAYARTEQLREIVDAHNERMRAVAAELAVAFVDLPARSSGDPTYFYDGIHFNEAGARAVAHAVATALAETVLADAQLEVGP